MSLHGRTNSSRIRTKVHLMAINEQVLPAEPRPVTNEYWGEQLVDKYQYFEDPANEEQRRWSREQATRATAYLSGLPTRDHFQQELERIVGYQAPLYYDVRLHRESGDKVFFSQKRLPPHQQPLVVTTHN